MTALNKLRGEPAGPPSESVTILTLKDVPDHPGKPRLGPWMYTTNSSVQIELSWDSPVANGDPVVGYQVLKSEGNDEWGWQEVTKTTSSSATSMIIPGLRAGGISYMFKVAAINEMGKSDFSPDSDDTVSPPRKIPDVIVGASVSNVYCQDANCGFELNWLTPLANGEDIKGYRIEYQQNGKGPFETLVADTESQVTRAVIPASTRSPFRTGEMYRLKVRAQNAVGRNDEDANRIVEVHMPAGVPSKVDKPVYAKVEASTLLLSWTAPKDGGKPITGYRITYETGGAGGYFTKIKNSGSTDTETEITGLEPGGVVYNFKVAAINSVGTGPDSDASDPAQTAVSHFFAVQRATDQATKTFQQTHKLHTVEHLDAEMEMYKKLYEDMTKTYRKTDERGQKAENQITALHEKMALDKSLAQKEIALERNLNEKKIENIMAIDKEVHDVNTQLADKRTSRVIEVNGDRVDEQRAYYEKKQRKEEAIQLKKDAEISLLKAEVAKEKEWRKSKEAADRNAQTAQAAANSELGESEKARLETMFDASLGNVIPRLAQKVKRKAAFFKAATSKIKASVVKVDDRSISVRPGALEGEVIELGEHTGN